MDPVARQRMSLRSRLPTSGGVIPAPSQPTPQVAPGTGSLGPFGPRPPSPDSEPSLDLVSYRGLEVTAVMAQEGGNQLIARLLSMAVLPEDELALPTADPKVKDWHYQDILRLPNAEKEE